jgi:hypothetical protein
MTLEPARGRSVDVVGSFPREDLAGWSGVGVPWGGCSVR